jgi:glyoxylase-like metal-dependent hydrolase (beta-lactamase superfamily II)
MFNKKGARIPEDLAYITEHDIIRFGNSELQVALTPGHSIASLTFYNTEQRIMIAGDVLFRESIGRTDLPGGDHTTLLESIRTKLYVLPDDMTVYPGHGEPTTIGHEKKHNPYVQG